MYKHWLYQSYHLSSYLESYGSEVEGSRRGLQKNIVLWQKGSYEKAESYMPDYTVYAYAENILYSITNTYERSYWIYWEEFQTIQVYYLLHFFLKSNLFFLFFARLPSQHSLTHPVLPWLGAGLDLWEVWSLVRGNICHSIISFWEVGV